MSLFAYNAKSQQSTQQPGHILLCAHQSFAQRISTTVHTTVLVPRMQLCLTATYPAPPELVSKDFFAAGFIGGAGSISSHDTFAAGFIGGRVLIECGFY